MRLDKLVAQILGVLVSVWPLAVLAAGQGPPSIVVDGSRLLSDVPALVSGATVYVPLRDVVAQLGGSVFFEDTSGHATASLDSTVVGVTAGSRQVTINGQPRILDAPAREVAGRVMVPLRFLALAFGFSVDYDAPSNTVVIVTGHKQGSFAAYAGGPVFSLGARPSPSVVDERPASSQIVGSQYPSIYARFAGGASAVNPSTVTITVDGSDVTDSATISSAYVSYTPATPLQTGLHNVYVSGQTDDGTPFSYGWSFRVDAGEASDYTLASYGAGAYANWGYPPSGYGYGWPWFGRFHFFPPGFSVFTPGPLYFVSGAVVEVIFFNRFFPFGNAFFSISGCPGTFALTPWLGNPGFFWGFMQVPFGLRAHHATIAVHFRTRDGRTIVVHSTAPLEIEGERAALPSDVRYAVYPTLVSRPPSPRQLVIFHRLEPLARSARAGGLEGGLQAPGHPTAAQMYPNGRWQLYDGQRTGQMNAGIPLPWHLPQTGAQPPALHPPVLIMPPVHGFSIPPWHTIAPARPAVPGGPGASRPLRG